MLLYLDTSQGGLVWFVKFVGSTTFKLDVTMTTCTMHLVTHQIKLSLVLEVLCFTSTLPLNPSGQDLLYVLILSSKLVIAFSTTSTIGELCLAFNW